MRATDLLPPLHLVKCPPSLGVKLFLARRASKSMARIWHKRKGAKIKENRSLNVSTNSPSENLKNSPRGLVARTGFEPVISALRGQRPRPLDERATRTPGKGGTSILARRHRPAQTRFPPPHV